MNLQKFLPSEQEINAMSNTKLMCVDIETHDPKLITHGPGTHRGDGHICGVTFGCINEGVETSFYLPTAIPDSNLLITQFNPLIDSLLSVPCPKIGANIAYDIEWLQHCDYEIALPKIHDVQYAEPLLNEYRRSYKLDSLAKQYVNDHKYTYILEEYNEKMQWQGEAIANLWRMPLEIQAKYAKQDAILPIKIFEKQKMHLESQKLYDLYELETGLIPCVLEMRKNGVRIDVKQLHKLSMYATDKLFDLDQAIYKWAGCEFNIGSASQLAKIFDNKGMPYPRHAPTPKMQEKGKQGNPNIDKNVLEKLSADYPICKTILKRRRFATMISLFLQPYTGFEANGRLYATFHPLRSDNYGTVSGRFSASKPNLTQVSAKEEKDEEGIDEELQGKIVRKLFKPEEGHKWVKNDYSQIEYRVLANYAKGPAGEVLRESYNKSPDTDFHQIIMDESGFERRTAKTLNFGCLYGMGHLTAAQKYGWTVEQALDFVNGYHRAAPYVKTTRNQVIKIANQRGFIFTILGRKARVHESRKVFALFNRLIQGTAADIMKKAMLDCWNSGVFDVLKLHLTVHDEIDFSMPETKEGEEARKETTRLMENAVKLKVPVLVDSHIGDNWAEAD